MQIDKCIKSRICNDRHDSQPWWGTTNVKSLKIWTLIHMTASSFQVNRYILGAFQMGYISLRRALWSENNHGRHIEGSFQTEVLKTSPFKGPFRMKDFEGYNWWTLRAPMILCAESLHDDGSSMSVQDDDAEGHFRKQLFGPLHLSNLRSSHYGGQPL